MNNHKTITTFLPKQIDIRQLDLVQLALQNSNLIVYGEIHGIKENADIVYTLVRKLGTQRLAIEASPTVLNFINSVKAKVYDFSLVDEDLFESSILSIEMIKTIAILLQQGQLKELVLIDTFFDILDKDAVILPSPQEREEQLVENIRSIDDSLPTLCIMGQWHTQPNVVKNDKIIHKSALYRLRKVKPNVPFVHNIYRQGELFNDGRVIELPYNPAISSYYEIIQKTGIDFDLYVPKATRIDIPE
ncbi:hypothetical protein [Candidatus Nanosynbacter lyticus]|jgi:hypothetical protein cdivTM_01651|uniref:hypothetical protein n=1 Tax=Candidatus Nanosynbacter lyticus TaxID=2093824 RepID=UPI002553BC64|nr:hypothetical protein [Candidatus Nanosynbacter lyticus]WLD47178.1 hypothetical protein NLML1_0826 [Candidatus Nanosynbacter lyticus]